VLKQAGEQIELSNKCFSWQTPFGYLAKPKINYITKISEIQHFDHKKAKNTKESSLRFFQAGLKKQEIYGIIYGRELHAKTRRRVSSETFRVEYEIGIDRRTKEDTLCLISTIKSWWSRGGPEASASASASNLNVQARPFV
jgi:hypothetical protein